MFYKYLLVNLVISETVRGGLLLCLHSREMPWNDRTGRDLCTKIIRTLHMPCPHIPGYEMVRGHANFCFYRFRRLARSERKIHKYKHYQRTCQKGMLSNWVAAVGGFPVVLVGEFRLNIYYTHKSSSIINNTYIGKISPIWHVEFKIWPVPSSIYSTCLPAPLAANRHWHKKEFVKD